MNILSKIFSKPSGKIEDTEDDTNPALNITELPQDVLGEIFSHIRDVDELMNLRLVSKSFKEASELKFSWKNIAESMEIEADDFDSFNKEIKVYAKDIITIWKIAKKSIETSFMQKLFFRQPDFKKIEKEKLSKIIKKFDKWIEKTQIKKLWLYNIGLNYFPSSVGNLKTLEILNLHSNNLKTLPKNIKNLTNLKKLYISENQLTTLPEELWDLTNLEALSIYNNKLKTISENIQKLKNIYHLRIGGDEFTLPETILCLPKLSSLSITRNLKYLDIIKKLEERGIRIEILE